MTIIRQKDSIRKYIHTYTSKLIKKSYMLKDTSHHHSIIGFLHVSMKVTEYKLRNNPWLPKTQELFYTLLRMKLEGGYIWEKENQ